MPATAVPAARVSGTRTREGFARDPYETPARRHEGQITMNSNSTSARKPAASSERNTAREEARQALQLSMDRHW